MPVKKPAKTPKQKKKAKKSKKESKETGLSKKEETVLDVWKLMDEKMIHDFVKAAVTGNQDEALCLAERCPCGCGRRLMLFPCSEHNGHCYVCSNLACDGDCFDVDGKAKPYAEDGGFGN